MNNEPRMKRSNPNHTMSNAISLRGGTLYGHHELVKGAKSKFKEVAYLNSINETDLFVDWKCELTESFGMIDCTLSFFLNDVVMEVSKFQSPVLFAFSLTGNNIDRLIQNNLIAYA